MSEHVGATDGDIAQANYFQKEGAGKRNAPDLPAWVKCMYCGTRPVWGNLLGEVVRHSSALACQNCMKARGKIFGLNIGQTQLDAKPNSEGDDNGLITVST